MRVCKMSMRTMPPVCNMEPNNEMESSEDSYIDRTTIPNANNAGHELCNANNAGHELCTSQRVCLKYEQVRSEGICRCRCNAIRT